MAAEKDFEVTIYMDGEGMPIFPESGYLAIRESMDFLVPSATLSFRDHISMFVSGYPVLQDTTFGIALNDGETSKNIPFYAFSDVKKQKKDSNLDVYDFNLDLISMHANGLMTDGEFHSKKCKASEYVQYIADKLGMDSDIEDTRDVKTWINPNWRYSQMLRFLATRSISSAGGSGYAYFVNSDGELVFKSIDGMFEQEASEDIVVILNNSSEDTVVVDRDVTLKGNYFSNIILGANNVKARFWDYATGAYVEKPLTYNKYIQKRGFSKGISQDFATTGTTKYFGEMRTGDLTAPTVLNTSIFKQTLLQAEMFQMELLTVIDLDRKVGDIVNITMPAREELQQGEIAMNYSGRYLIKGITTMGSADYYQKLHLIRPGINIESSRTGYY